MKQNASVSITAGFFILTLLASCGGFRTSEKQNAALDTADVFRNTAVMTFVKSHAPAGKESDKYFSKGVDEFRNKKSPVTAYDLFLRSVCAYPTARAYYELGNVCAERKDYDHAIAAYNIAEQLGYEPVSKLFYNISCAYSLQEKDYESATYLGYAIEAGYSNLKQIMSDPDLEYARKSYLFEASYQDAMSGASDGELTLWQSFKRQFRQVALPLVLDLKTQIGEIKNINFEYEKFVSEMRNEKFSRDVGKEFYYYATIEDNANYTALVYVVKNIIMSENAPSRYVLVSFDSRGTLIDKKPVGGQMELNEPCLVCTIRPNLNFEVKQYRNTYERDPAENGYENNPVVKSDLVATENFRIDEHGRFVQQGQELTMR